MTRLILASGSPRRRELLGLTGLPFTVAAADLDETPHPGEEAAAYVARLALAKARAVADQPTHRGAVVLGADTVVVVDGLLLGKPLDDDDAKTMLRRLAGRSHAVFTGVAVVWGDGEASEVVRTEVVFSAMSDDEIAWYTATGEPRDKAGAYAIQGYGALFIEEVRGNYPNVVGLPLPTTRRLLHRAGVHLELRSWAAS